MQKQKIKINYPADQSIFDLASVSFSIPLEQDKSVCTSVGERKVSRLSYEHKDLERIITRHKVKRLVNNFTKKTRLNSVYRVPMSDIENSQPENKHNSLISRAKKCVQNLSQKQGILLGNLGLIIWSITNILQISLMVFVFSIMMAFPQTQKFPLFLYFRSISIVLYVIDMFLNFTVTRYQSGKYLNKIREIGSDYLRRGFSVDLISILIFPIDLLVQDEYNITIFISLLAIIKLVNNIKKFQKFQYLIINSSGKQHYFGLIKVFLTNFAIGHLLSICLNLMSYIDQSSNWHTKFGISNAKWYIKYSWGYYWGTNIMLTVGFGDIAASNYYQAIVLVFIQTLSCITLAYNINNVGALISSIRQSNEQKKKRLKVFHRMCKDNFITNQMESKVANFIQEEYRIKESFQYDEHDEMLKSLPKNLETQFRKEANKTLFENIGFLKYLSKKSLYKLAQVVSRKICHPQEILFAKGSASDFMILQRGALSFVCRIRSILDGNQMQIIDIKQGQKPKILSFDFIKNKTLNYNIKSKNYSVLYYLSRQQLMDSLRSSDMDYQMFCQLRDKDQQEIFEHCIYPCEVCKSQLHNKFECNRLHFVPLKRTIVLKYIFRINKIKQQRKKAFNRTKNELNPTRMWKSLKEEQKRFIQLNYDDEHYKEIENLVNFYSKFEKNLDNSLEMTENIKSQITNNKSTKSSKAGAKTLFDDKALVKLEQILENKGNRIGFNIWDFEIDEAENFNFYFREGNPDQLKRLKKPRKNKGISKFFNIDK